MSSDIKNVETRSRLKPRREPYYAKIRTGYYLGFRKMTASTDGAWVARCRVEATGKQMKAIAKWKRVGDNHHCLKLWGWMIQPRC